MSPMPERSRSPSGVSIAPGGTRISDVAAWTAESVKSARKLVKLIYDLRMAPGSLPDRTAPALHVPTGQKVGTMLLARLR